MSVSGSGASRRSWLGLSGRGWVLVALGILGFLGWTLVGEGRSFLGDGAELEEGASDDSGRGATSGRHGGTVRVDSGAHKGPGVDE